MIYGIVAIFLAIPIISIVWCISSLVEYRKAKADNMHNPDTHTEEEIKSLKKNLIISAIVAFVLTGVVVGIIITFALGIVYM
jgi:uncharacterized membrane protein